METIPEVTLNSGHRMPLIGLGTSPVPYPGYEVIKSAILSAIKLGYRHFDTASLYWTEHPLGDAIAEALRLGLIKSRDELFITSKLWCNDAQRDLVLPALKTTLQNLQLEYLDLYLIHWPVTMSPGDVHFPTPEDKFFPMDYKSVWAAMEECQKLGLTKSIGVSNFTCKKLDILLTSASIPPAVNQVEVNPFWQQEKLRKFCKAKDIFIAAYAPLRTGGSNQGKNIVMENELLREIARAREKTEAQVCLRWVYEQEVCLLVKSFNETRIKENLEVLSWALSEEDCKKISQLPQSRAHPADFFTSADGPFKSLEELWDGEI